MIPPLAKIADSVPFTAVSPVVGPIDKQFLRPFALHNRCILLDGEKNPLAAGFFGSDGFRAAL
jgi:hypothetical protein